MAAHHSFECKLAQHIQGLLQVCPDVLGVLNAAAEAHEVVGDAVLSSLLWALVPVGDDGGLLYEALHTSQRRGNVWQLHRVDDLHQQ